VIKQIISLILLTNSIYACEEYNASAGGGSGAGGHERLYPDLNEPMPVQPSVQPSAPPLDEEPNSNMRQPANQRHQPSFEERQRAFREESERRHQEFRENAKQAHKEFDEKIRQERAKREKELANIKLAASIIELIGRTAPIWANQFINYPKLSMVSWTAYAAGGYYYAGELRSNPVALVGFLVGAFFTVPVVGALYDWLSSKTATTPAPKAAPKKEVTVLVPVKVALR
jgi:hypothetical protein